MLSNLVITHGQFLTYFQPAANNRLTVQSPAYKLSRVIDRVDTHPHPLAFAGHFIGKLNFDVIA